MAYSTESINTFDPLMHLIQSNVDMDALDRGRPVVLALPESAS